jgi:hypothetical protein
MSELPPGVGFEETWLIEATYAPDGAESRAPFRSAHLARMAELRDAGILVEVGAYADVSASILIVRAASEEAALAIARDDVYLANGVWVEVRARRFMRMA